ncbi:MAG: metal ABC transporter permease [Chloroflexota bacterium]|nr:metal ABC transporter permease [Chloroflexota bacterium]
MFFQTNTKINGPTWNLLVDWYQVFQYDFMTNAFIAGTIVAVLAGVVGYFVVLRRLGFACDALSHGGFAGATGAVVLGQDAFLGLLVFTSVTGGFMGLLGDRIRGRDVAIGGTLAFSLALGSLFLTISTKFAGQAVNILFGNVLAISRSDLIFVAVFAGLGLLMLGAMYRPLLFSSVDVEIADARGVPVRFLSVAFMVLLAVTVSASVQVVGVLLIFGLLILPAAAAQHLTAQPSRAIALAVVLSVAYVWIGLLVCFYLPYPPSFFITAFAFVTFVGVRGLSPGVAGGRRPGASVREHRHAQALLSAEQDGSRDSG